MWRRAPWCGEERPDVEESVMVWRECPDVEGVLVWRRASWCGGERPDVEGVLVRRRAPWCGGECPVIEESAMVCMRAP